MSEARVQPGRVDAAAIRERVLNDPDVKRGIQDYLDRYERHHGNVPTISRDEALRRLKDS